MDREIPFYFSDGRKITFNDPRIQSDLLFIQQHLDFDLPKQWAEHLHGKKLTEIFSTAVGKISYDENHCLEGQVSCIMLEHEKVIFLTPSYFLMNQLDRTMTLLHEMYHLLKNGAHVPCRDESLQGQECDEKNLSAYGLELYVYDILKKKLKHSQDFFSPKIDRLYKSRINENLIKHL
jgi:hypothetical protein